MEASNPAESDLAALGQLFKVLADENRLKIISLLIHRVHTVGELAQALGLTEPTVSHHLSRLREQGLVNLRAVGTSRLYSFNDWQFEQYRQALPQQLDHIGSYLLSYQTPDAFHQEVSQARADADAWIEDLDISEADRKVLRDYTYKGLLKQVPSKEKKLRVIIRWLATKFEPGRRYAEPEVNAVLEALYPDYATLRRELIVFKVLERDRSGQEYRLADPQPEI